MKRGRYAAVNTEAKMGASGGIPAPGTEGEVFRRDSYPLSKGALFAQSRPILISLLRMQPTP